MLKFEVKNSNHDDVIATLSVVGFFALFIPIFIFLFFLLSPKIPLDNSSANNVIETSSQQKVDSYYFARYAFITIAIIGVICFIPIYIKLFVFMPKYAKPLNPYKLKED